MRALELAAASALALSACGSATTGGVTVAGGADHRGAPDARDRPSPRYERAWDHGNGGLDTTAADAQRVGQLPFAVRNPAWGVEPNLVQVADPATTAAEARVAYLFFRFPPGPEFPVDGRVVLSMKPTAFGPDQLRLMDERNEPADSYRMVEVGGRQVLMITDQAGGRARIQYIADGVLYDILGPELSPATARRLADRALPQ